MEHTTIVKTLDELQNAANWFFDLLKTPRAVAFYGDMGAGKTTFIKALCQKLEVLDTVNSPTFAIINEYQTTKSKPVYHFDLYRIEDPQELLSIGFEEYFSQACWCFVEWPQVAEGILSDSIVSIRIEEIEKGWRKITLIE
ncbi:MAG: tRNA (adenosine(37)-N6)-threonylcarbamoyltransferase complex ATPase subunit type 1 TsaE [Bacteroidales bacterium]|nr:tRNA (adenosine(37)-N6)-threonylcarbamoyltransferase complex ATPase subunit type 1 TsaE [Bacteroidales bacterium]